MDSIIYIARFSSPIGSINVASSDIGVISIDFNSSAKEFYLALKESLGEGFELLERERRFKALFTLFHGYFSGKESSFDSVKVDLNVTAFRGRVLRELRKIPFGASLSYAQIARRAGSPKGARAVGGACATNPVPLIIPCHRVISSDGSLGGYSAGGRGEGSLELKRALLSFEGIRIQANSARSARRR